MFLVTQVLYTIHMTVLSIFTGHAVMLARLPGMFRKLMTSFMLLKVQSQSSYACLHAGDLLPVFLAGSVATVLSTLLAITVFPLASLGENGWKIAAALCARHIGGAINYVAVTAVTHADQAIVSAGLAADNLICAVYFSTIYALARGIPPDKQNTFVKTSHVPENDILEDSKSQMTILGGMTALALSAVICHIGRALAVAIGLPGMLIPIITVITVTLATAFPKPLKALSESAEALAAILMQVCPHSKAIVKECMAFNRCPLNR